MLRIYDECLQMVADVRPYADRIARFDLELSRQLRKASVSVVLNVAEGSGTRAGRRRQTYEIALGEAKETRAGLQASERIGYVSKVAPEVLARLDHIIGTLVKNVR